MQVNFLYVNLLITVKKQNHEIKKTYSSDVNCCNHTYILQ